MTARTFTPPASMLATLIAHRNARLSFEVKTGGFTPNDTDNPIPETSTLEFEATAYNSERPEDAVQQFFKGKESSVVWYEGRIVVPQSLPDSIKHLSRGRMSLGKLDQDGNFTEEKKGSIVLYNPQKNVLIGDKLGTQYYAVFLSD